MVHHACSPRWRAVDPTLHSSVCWLSLGVSMRTCVWTCVVVLSVSWAMQAQRLRESVDVLWRRASNAPARLSRLSCGVAAASRPSTFRPSVCPLATAASAATASSADGDSQEAFRARGSVDRPRWSWGSAPGTPARNATHSSARRPQAIGRRSQLLQQREHAFSIAEVSEEVSSVGDLPNVHAGQVHQGQL